MVPIKPTHKLLGQNVFLLLKIVCTEALTIYETFKCDKNALSKFYIKVQSKYKLWTKIIFPLPSAHGMGIQETAQYGTD